MGEETDTGAGSRVGTEVGRRKGGIEGRGREGRREGKRREKKEREIRDGGQTGI